ncbi:CAP domain-containing protein [Streptomyces sp. Tue6028]|uniref:CAP domain-containing protein n=1 Tax=Streptomyces sp. Tue6028 TaxID=2036037 RepID=UPI003D755E4D
MRTSTRIRRLCAATCAAPLLVLAGAAGAGAATATVPATTPNVVQATPSEILDLVNAERAKANCPALKENAQLTKAAQVFADDASKNNLTTHTGSDGSTDAQRVKDAGYNAKESIGVGENMAWGSSTDAKSIVDGWIKSSGHHRNIVNCSYVDTGVAVSGKYAVQVFASPA